MIISDKSNCNLDVNLMVSVVQFPKYFTPNGDDQNDYWKVKGVNLSFYKNSFISIFNRFGVFKAKIPINDKGWDGTYQGKILPSGNYWYKVTLNPNDSSKPIINKKGYFSLLRK